MKKMDMASVESINNISVPANEKVSGIPFISNGESRVISRNYHTLVVSEDDYQKDEKIICPLIEQISKTKESFIFNSKSDYIYQKYVSSLKNSGYKVVCINIDNPINNDGLNILELAYNLYKEKNVDKAIELLENIGFYLLYAPEEHMTDPFWNNSAVNLFIGCTLYSFEKNDNYSLKDIFNLVDDIKLEDIDKNSVIYGYVNSILSFPQETISSIISVIKEKFGRYVLKDNLCNMVTNSTFDIKKITDKNLAIFIVEGTSNVSRNLVPIIINNIYTICNIYGNHNKINILLNNFDMLAPLKNVESFISICSNININITAFINNFDSLNKTYGFESSEMLKMFFKSLIYLYSENINTMKYISELCGSIEYMSNLRKLQENEALFIVVRQLPFMVNI